MDYLATPNNQYNIIGKKGSSEDRDEYLAKDNQTQINYLIVIKNPDNNGNNNCPANEINALNILHNVNNPYIVHFIENGNGTLTLNNEPPRNVNYLIFEYVSRFPLFNYIEVKQFTEKHAKLLFKKILNGVQAMHNAHICHRDIKPQNILLDENYNPKIFDFTFSSINANNWNYYLCTQYYSAPEIIENHPYDGFKADIFSLGQLLFNLVNKIYGFKSSLANEQYYSLSEIIILMNIGIPEYFII